LQEHINKFGKINLTLTTYSSMDELILDMTANFNKADTLKLKSELLGFKYLS